MMKQCPVFLFECFLPIIVYESDLQWDEYFQTCDALVLLNTNDSHHKGPFNKLRWNTK